VIANAADYADLQIVEAHFIRAVVSVQFGLMMASARKKPVFWLPARTAGGSPPVALLSQTKTLRLGKSGGQLGLYFKGKVVGGDRNEAYPSDFRRQVRFFSMLRNIRLSRQTRRS